VFVCVCVCVFLCVCMYVCGEGWGDLFQEGSGEMCACVCVCMCVCARVFMCVLNNLCLNSCAIVIMYISFLTYDVNVGGLGHVCRRGIRGGGWLFGP
jgi:hypothetical protein